MLPLASRRFRLDDSLDLLMHAIHHVLIGQLDRNTHPHLERRSICCRLYSNALLFLHLCSGRCSSSLSAVARSSSPCLFVCVAARCSSISAAFESCRRPRHPGAAPHMVEDDRIIREHWSCYATWRIPFMTSSHPLTLPTPHPRPG